MCAAVRGVEQVANAVGDFTFTNTRVINGKAGIIRIINSELFGVAVNIREQLHFNLLLT